MKKFWKEKYTKEMASSCGIRAFEGGRVTAWGIGEEAPSHIYYVEVVNFTFAFFSMEMLETYIEFFGLKVLPSTRSSSKSNFSYGAAACQGGGQSPFERLPARLRKRNVRPKVLKALQEARVYFEKNT